MVDYHYSSDEESVSVTDQTSTMQEEYLSELHEMLTDKYDITFLNAKDEGLSRNELVHIIKDKTQTIGRVTQLASRYRKKERETLKDGKRVRTAGKAKERIIGKVAAAERTQEIEASGRRRLLEDEAPAQAEQFRTITPQEYRDFLKWAKRRGLDDDPAAGFIACFHHLDFQSLEAEGSVLMEIVALTDLARDLDRASAWTPPALTGSGPSNPKALAKAIAKQEEALARPGTRQYQQYKKAIAWSLSTATKERTEHRLVHKKEQKAARKAEAIAREVEFVRGG